MTQFYYTAQFIMRRAGRKSATAAVQLKPHMPTAEAVLVSERGAVGWSLNTWQQVAKTRRSPLQEDLLKVISELREEEIALAEKYRK